VSQASLCNRPADPAFIGAFGAGVIGSLLLSVLLSVAFAAGGTAEAGPAKRVERSHPAEGIKRLILRVSGAQAAKVETRAGTTVVVVSGLPVGGAKGYHSPDKNWKETAPEDGGLDFVFKAYGATLVVSSRNEIRFIHHHYALDEVEVRVPPGVEIVREGREPTGNGAPDLREPDPEPSPSPPSRRPRAESR
jgi:hypothetical protein